MKEYGGYFPIEQDQRNEFYEGDSVVKLNSGRSAIIYAVRDGGFKKVFIPIYLCKSVAEALTKENIDFGYYNINNNFMPIDVIVGPDECILYPNYYGNISRLKIEELTKKYKDIIFDNTQAFFAEPIMTSYNVYSCRKFFGVSDGAYLIKYGLRKIEMNEDISSERASFLLKAIEFGTNSAYIDSVKNEDIIEKSSMLSMSILTKRILMSIDYNSVIRKRQINIKYIHEKLGKYNKLNSSINTENILMVYPFYNDTDGLRKYLVENKIYVPQWWKFILDEEKSNKFERGLSNHLLPIPIDQRYNTEDMDYIVELIIDYIKG